MCHFQIPSDYIVVNLNYQSNSYLFFFLSFYEVWEMATHSIILVREIPWMEEPGGLQSTGLQRVGHDWAGTGWAYTKNSVLLEILF